MAIHSAVLIVYRSLMQLLSMSIAYVVLYKIGAYDVTAQGRLQVIEPYINLNAWYR